jgi:AcrR family transcriptional regulator
MATSRPYQSTRRKQQAAQTRERILEAARQLFVEKGYAATSLADIAHHAEVSVPTLYASIGPKPAIGFALVEHITNAVGIPELDREQMATTTGPELVRANVHLARLLNERAGDEIRAMAAAATAAPELAAVMEEGERYHVEAEQRIAGILSSMGALREEIGVEHAAALLITLNSTDVHNRLSKLPGSSPEHAERWLADALVHLLLAPQERAGP